MVTNISQDSRAISDYLDSFSSLMVHPDGSLADLSDRGGRKDLNYNIKKNTEAVETMSVKIAETPKKMLEAIPESVKAEFCMADRERFDRLFKRMGRFVDWAIPCSVVVGIVIGGFTILAAMGYSKACDYREKMETQAKEQKETIDFGNYMKEKNPKTLERWRIFLELWTALTKYRSVDYKYWPAGNIQCAMNFANDQIYKRTYNLSNLH